MADSNTNDSLGTFSEPQIVGQRIDRYDVLQKIGEGGMATVYLASRENDYGFRRLLAVKLLHAKLRDDARMAAMFRDEAAILGKLAHPNIVQVFDAGVHDGTPFLVMEYLRGQPLSRMITHSVGHPKRIGVLLYILAQVAEGVHAAHEATDERGENLGVVHRDINPRNLLVGYDGQVKIVDFGIAAANDRESKTETGELKGTFGYLAPEQVLGGLPLDRRIDVWAMGVVAWEAFAGARLFASKSTAQVLWNVMNHEPSPLQDTGVDASVAEIIHRCLSREREERPANADELAHVFRDAARAHGVTQKDLKSLMHELFDEQRQKSEREIAVAIESMASDGDVSPTSLAPIEAGPQPTDSVVLPIARRSSRGVVFALATAVLGLGAWWALVPVSSGEPTPLPVPVPTAVVPTEAPALVPVELEEPTSPDVTDEEPDEVPERAPLVNSTTIEEAALTSPMRRRRRRARTPMNQDTSGMRRYISEAPY